MAPDIDEVRARAEELGGRLLFDRSSDDGFRWLVLADPEGNEFCVSPEEEAAGDETA
jgi:predicted enzyme related to lactoylglutathione lyase